MHQPSVAADVVVALPAVDAFVSATPAVAADAFSLVHPRTCESAPCVNPNREFPPVRPVP